MKTQISRDSHRPEKRYSGVYQQQGRMLTDADWNELVEVVKRRLDQALVGVVDSGAPREPRLGPAPDGPEFGARLDPSPAPFRIRGGLVFADGVVARLAGRTPTAETFAYTRQADFPSPPPLPAGEYLLYADVWERPVVALEDPGQLLDPALHGADTTTRTQTMAQVKRCPDAIEPEDPAANPGIGSAELSLELRPRSAAADPCDPCADEVAIEAGTGAYLFRVEVHDVGGSPGNPTSLVLKWSSENGAEQYDLPGPGETPLPTHFTSGDWIFELANETTEKHLGVHLGAPPPQRGRLEEGFPESIPKPFRWVRRWDGYCTLTRSGSTWSLTGGRDRGVELSTSSDAEADGHVELGDELTIRLQSLLLELRLKNRVFVAGDYWQAPVRATQQPGETLLDEAPPLGIVHHYLRLGRVDAGGKLVALKADERRRLSFPPLTDLEARDIEFKKPCNTSIYQGQSPQTVADALELLCNVTADQIGYTNDCGTSVFTGQSPQTVADALDLLCHVSAEEISYTPHPDCPSMPANPTVQQAIDALCQRPAGGGCRVTVGEEGEFESLKEALDALGASATPCVRICLGPGEHELPAGLVLEQPFESVSIEGCGPATRLVAPAVVECKALASLGLEKLALDLGDSGGLFADGCAKVELSALRVTGRREEAQPLLTLWNADEVRIAGCLIEAESPNPLEVPRAIFQGVGMLPQLFALPDRASFEKGAQEYARALLADSRGARRELAESIAKRAQEQQLEVDHGWGVTLSGPDMPWSSASYSHFLEALAFGRADLPDQRVVETLNEIRAKSLGVLGLLAVVIEGDQAPEALIEGNEIVGRLLLPGRDPDNDLVPRLDPGEITNIPMEALKKAIQEFRLTVRSADRNLRLLDNRLTSLDVQAAVTRVCEGLANASGQVEGLFRTAQARGNVLLLPRFHLAAEEANLTANSFEALFEEVGWVLASRATYTGNSAPAVDEDRSLLHDLARVSSQAANLLRIA